MAGIELDYMRALAVYVGTSPRRVKRLVNAYRLLKASLTDSQLRTFLTNRAADGGVDRSGPYQIVIGLLVIGTGVLGSSAQILGELSGWDPNKKWSDVIDSFRARNDPCVRPTYTFCHSGSREHLPHKFVQLRVASRSESIPQPMRNTESSMPAPNIRSFSARTKLPSLSSPTQRFRLPFTTRGYRQLEFACPATEARSNVGDDPAARKLTSRGRPHL
jgi:hypothetical protein